MSSLRNLERNIIREKCYKQNGNTSKFAEEWKTFRTAKFGENNIPVNTMPKKKRFLDKKDSFINALKYQKMMIQNYIAQKKAEKEAAVTAEIDEAIDKLKEVTN
jgi:hypothetical protein